MKRIDRLVFGQLPTLGGARLGRDAARIFAHESFEQRHDDVMLRDTGDDMRIEIGRFRAVVDVENLLPIARRDARFPAAAAAEHGQGKDDDQRARHAPG